jgi:1,4-dihydroxy-2-naphthoate octaprenyltransferase
MNQSISIWLEAARPKTLPLALVSILTGSTLAYSMGHFSLLVMLLALVTAILLQILSNLANDYGDSIKGTDNNARLGPMRALQSGAVSLNAMRNAIGINIVLTMLSGLGLVLYALDSWENILGFLGLGGLAILAAIAYTVGRKPYGYIGLGDLSVFIFFGLLGVYGTYFLHAGSIEHRLFLPSIGCGLLAVAVLNVNNMRDIDNDKACGKRTVAVRLGTDLAKWYHFVLIFGALTAFASYLALQTASIWISLPFAVSLVVIKTHVIALKQARDPIEIAPMLPVIVKCAVLINLLFIAVVIAQTLVS